MERISSSLTKSWVGTLNLTFLEAWLQASHWNFSETQFSFLQSGLKNTYLPRRVVAMHVGDNVCRWLAQRLAQNRAFTDSVHGGGDGGGKQHRTVCGRKEKRITGIQAQSVHKRLQLSKSWVSHQPTEWIFHSSPVGTGLRIVGFDVKCLASVLPPSANQAFGGKGEGSPSLEELKECSLPDLKKGLQTSLYDAQARYKREH